MIFVSPYIHTRNNRHAPCGGESHAIDTPRILVPVGVVAPGWREPVQGMGRKGSAHCQRAVRGKHLHVAGLPWPEQPLDTAPTHSAPDYCAGLLLVAWYLH